MNTTAVTRNRDPFGVSKMVRNDLGHPFNWIDDFFKTTFPDSTGNSSYPPYDIIKRESGKFALNVAVAGFSKDDIETYINEDGNLCITGEKTEENSDDYVYQGIAKRKFKFNFQMPRDSEVESCKLEDGMLQLEISAKEEENSRKSIPIT